MGLNGKTALDILYEEGSGGRSQASAQYWLELPLSADSLLQNSLCSSRAANCSHPLPWLSLWLGDVGFF